MGSASDNAHEAIEQLSEKQNLLANPTEGKMSPQNVALEELQRQIFQLSKELEGQKTKEARELLGREPMLGNSVKERNRARM